jgi:hypothetical protein
MASSDKIQDFEGFKRALPEKHPGLTVRPIGESEVTISQTNELGKEVIFFAHFQDAKEKSFPGVKVVKIQRGGMAVPKSFAGVPRNSLICRWYILIDKACMYQPSDREILEAATDVMDGFSFKVHQAPAYMFAMQQLSLLMVDKFGRRHGRQTLTLASTI